jgi:hypothetical protein
MTRRPAVISNAMRQLGEGVQSEERQMLLPFLRHLSLRPAAARLARDRATASVPIRPDLPLRRHKQS